MLSSRYVMLTFVGPSILVFRRNKVEPRTHLKIPWFLELRDYSCGIALHNDAHIFAAATRSSVRTTAPGFSENSLDIRSSRLIAFAEIPTQEILQFDDKSLLNPHSLFKGLPGALAQICIIIKNGGFLDENIEFITSEIQFEDNLSSKSYNL